MIALSRLAFDAYDEVSELRRSRGRARLYKSLESFRELLSLLESSFFFGDAIKFSETTDTHHWDFWCHVARVYQPRVDLPPGIAWALFSGVYASMRTCKNDPCYCKEREIEAIMRFCRGLMVASQSNISH